MCILYFKQHQTCGHKRLISEWKCQEVQCPFEAQHKFYIEDNSPICNICDDDDNTDFDPDAIPVDTKLLEEELDLEPDSRAEPVNAWKHDYKSLSDVDSDTSHWKLDEKTAPSDTVSRPVSPSQAPSSNDIDDEQAAPPVAAGTYSPVPSSPYHQDLDQGRPEATETATLPPDEHTEVAPQARPEGPAQHRTLIKNQLAMLPQYLAVQRRKFGYWREGRDAARM